MAKWNVGPKNGMWKGGRTITEHGYVLIRVGKDHPLADCRGYAYEHRLKAEACKGDLVHHDNETRNDNSENNLVKVSSIAEHMLLHRDENSKLRKPNQDNPELQCYCGCGSLLLRFDKLGRPRRYISGHNLKGGRNV